MPTKAAPISRSVAALIKRPTSNVIFPSSISLEHNELLQIISVWISKRGTKEYLPPINYLFDKGLWEEPANLFSIRPAPLVTAPRRVYSSFGVVCAFVTNQYMQDGTKELPTNVKTSLMDVKLFLTTTKLQINNILQTNFDELEINLNSILQASGRIVTEQLAEYSHAVSLTNLSDIVAGLESIKEDLKTMQTITRDLRTNASQLDIGTRFIDAPLGFNSPFRSEREQLTVRYYDFAFLRGWEGGGVKSLWEGVVSEWSLCDFSFNLLIHWIPENFMFLNLIIYFIIQVV